MSDPVGAGAPTAAAQLRGDHARLMRAAQALEAVFFRQMLQAMRDAVPPAEQSAAEKTFQAMFDDELSRRAVAQNDHGLAAALYRQLSRHLPPEETAAAALTGMSEATDVSGS